MSLSKRGKWSNSEGEKANFQWLHVKLDKRILTALKRESEARGGSQEPRITEEALAVYLRLKGVANGVSGPLTIARPARDSQKRSRIVE